jgi:hypothetical protein
VFAEVVQDRTEATIVDVLHRHIAQGSILYTDCWKGYFNLARIYGIEHRTVNHSEGFKDPITGVHTNTVEGTNYALKRCVPPRNRTTDDLHMYLMEFVWRRKHANDLWEAFLEALRIVSYKD